MPPLLRYGKYCGLLYSGCPGEKPCDGLDACCMKHDQCVQAKNSMFSHFLSQILTDLYSIFSDLTRYATGILDLHSMYETKLCLDRYMYNCVEN